MLVLALLSLLALTNKASAANDSYTEVRLSVSVTGDPAALYNERTVLVIARNTGNKTAEGAVLKLNFPDPRFAKVKYPTSLRSNVEESTYAQWNTVRVPQNSSTTFQVTYTQKQKPNPPTQNWVAILTYNGTTVNNTFRQDVGDEAIDNRLNLYIWAPSVVKQNQGYQLKIELFNTQFKEEKDWLNDKNTIKDIEVTINIPSGQKIVSTIPSVRNENGVLRFKVDSVKAEQSYYVYAQVDPTSSTGVYRWSGKALWNGKPRRSRAVGTYDVNVVKPDYNTPVIY